jgi:hypothetical protein
MNTIKKALEKGLFSKELEAELQELLTAKTGQLPTKTSHLKLISGEERIIIDACEGTRTMNTMGKLFPGNIEDDFSNYGLNKPQSATDATSVRVYEITRDGVLAQFFTSFNVGLKSLVFTRDQIITFCEKNSNWLHPSGNATLFLTEENDEFFFVRVWCGVSSRRVNVGRLGRDSVYGASVTYRLVVPQLVPVTG